MPAPIPTSLTAIIPVVKSQLASATGLPLTSIRIVGRNQTPRFQGDRDILLRAGHVSWDQGYVDGSGRVCPLIRRPLLLRVRSRTGVDLSDQDDAKLLDPSLGLLPLEEAVVNALYQFMPADGQNNLLVVEPMSPVNYPEEEEQEGQAADWIEAAVAFEVAYILALKPQTQL